MIFYSPQRYFGGLPNSEDYCYKMEKSSKQSLVTMFQNMQYCYYPLNSTGVLPKTLLKTREKYAGSEKPAS